MQEYQIDNLNKVVNFYFDSNSTIARALKDISKTAQKNDVLGYWTIKVTEYTLPKIVKLIKDFDFTKRADTEAALPTYDYSLSKEHLEAFSKIFEKHDFAYVPRLYQIEALGYAMKKRNLIIGDDVGLGKTFEAILYAEVTNSFPCLVIVPSSVKFNWAEKWLEITKNRRSVSTIESAPPKKRPNNWNDEVVIINYDIIAKKKGKGATVKFSELVDIDWKMIIFDEGHFLKSNKAQRSKAALKIIKTGARIALLTGTATMNKPAELWNLLRIIKRDVVIGGNYMRYTREFCGGKQGGFGWDDSGATNTLELNRRLRDECYIRREKREVLTELPKITKQILKTPITNGAEYKRATNNFIDYIREEYGQEKAEKAMEAECLVRIGVLRRLSIAGKVKAIEQYLKDWKEVSTEKLIIFGVHREALDYLSDKFNSRLIAGGITTKQKHESIKAWCKDPDDLFIFGNMDTMGTGVDGFQHVCQNMIIIELPWRPSDLEQIIGRIDRSGQELPMSITFMLADETSDEDMWEMLKEKEAITEAVNKGIDIKKMNSGLKIVIRKMMERLKLKK